MTTRSYSPRTSTTVFVAALTTAALALGASAITGCSDTPPAQTVDNGTASSNPHSTPASSSSASGSNNDTKSSVSVDDAILKACGDIPVAHFAFDSAEVAADASNALDAIARCFVSGPLKGHAMKIIGYADPRGEPEYNLALGQRRAGSVANFLQRKGMTQDKLRTSSKGKFEATGTDEAGWAKDRKVEILLGD